MTKSVILSISIVIVFSLSSCNNRQSEEKDAENRLSKIEQLVGERAYCVAKSEIDSIHSLYPRLVDKRREAQAFMDTIVRRESARTIIYNDSVLLQKREEIAVMQRNFKFEKDEKYQEIGNFIHQTLRTEANVGRNYLKMCIDEYANIYLISCYCGSKIGHTHIVVSCDSFFAETSVINTSNPSNYSFTSDGQRWEMVTFENEDAAKVAEFITHYADKCIKVTLKGEKTYTYYLSEQDKKAIVESCDFWAVKKEIVQSEREIKQATAKIEHIKQRYSK